jgi:hypothetical protein
MSSSLYWRLSLFHCFVRLTYLRFEVLTVVKMLIVVFQIVMSYSLVGGYQHFGGIYYINPEGGGDMFL